MIRYKYALNQSIKVLMQNRWDWFNDYFVSGTIVGFGDVILNGVPTYNVKLNDQRILINLSEDSIQFIH